jgi:hypothetical protein
LLNPDVKFFERRHSTPALKKFHTLNQQHHLFENQLAAASRQGMQPVLLQTADLGCNLTSSPQAEEATPQSPFLTLLIISCLPVQEAVKFTNLSKWNVTLGLTDLSLLCLIAIRAVRVVPSIAPQNTHPHSMQFKLL